MPISTLTSKGQVTIPKEIRDALGLKVHDRVNFIERNGEIVIKPLKGNILDLKGSVKPKKRPENFEEVRKMTRKIIAKKAIRE
jgi:AbrB family looped-hinge helix DNA binding protein